MFFECREAKRIFFECLISEYGRRIEAYTRMNVYCAQDAQDIGQDVLLKAWENIEQLRRPDRAGSWLFSIASNEIATFYRRRTMDASLMNRLSSMAGAVKQPLHEQDELLCRQVDIHALGCFHELGRVDRLILTMRFLHGMSVSDIAASLRMPYNTVCSKLYRAKHTLCENIYKNY